MNKYFYCLIFNFLFSIKSLHAQDYNSTIITNIQKKDSNGLVWGMDPDALQLGGATSNDFPGSGQTELYKSVGIRKKSGRGSLASMTINCHPYGNYDAATCLRIFDTGADRDGSRAAVGGGLEKDPKNLSSYAMFENINLELDSNVPPPRLILKNVTYDKTHVYLQGCGPKDKSICIPMTVDQMSQLRHGMSLTTNSIPPSDIGKNILGGQRNKSMAKSYLYAAFVDTWDSSGRYIKIINGWSVMGDISMSNTTPSIKFLDKIWTQFSTPTIFLGAETSDNTEHHVVMNSYNPKGGASLAINQLAHGFTDGETDMENFSPIDYSDTFRGPTYSYVSGNTVSVPEKDDQCNKTGKNIIRYKNIDPLTRNVINLDSCGQPNGHPVYPTSDSWGLFIAGGFAQGGGSLLRLTGNDGEREIDANSIQMFSPSPVGANIGSVKEIGEIRATSDSAQERLVTWLNRENVTNIGYQQLSMNLGYWANGTSQSNFAETNLTGIPWARISWNSRNNIGGLDFYANNGIDMLSLKGNGDSVIYGDVNIKNSAKINGYLTVGGNGGNTNMKDFTTFYSGVNMKETMIVPFKTPPNSNSPCIKGQIEVDSKYIYTCIYRNKWHRIKNGTEW